MYPLSFKFKLVHWTRLWRKTIVIQFAWPKCKSIFQNNAIDANWLDMFYCVLFDCMRTCLCLFFQIETKRKSHQINTTEFGLMLMTPQSPAERCINPSMFPLVCCKRVFFLCVCLLSMQCTCWQQNRTK